MRISRAVVALLVVPVEPHGNFGAAERRQAFTSYTSSAPSSRSSAIGQSVRESLRAADAAASDTAWASGLGAVLTAWGADDVVLLYDGAPLVRGRTAATRLLGEQPALRALRVSWAPIRVLVSDDGALGVTFGTTTSAVSSSVPSHSKYISVWRADGASAWKLIAHVQAGLVASRRFVSVAGLAAMTTATIGNDPFAQADEAFAASAGQWGAPLAFERFAAPDAITFSGTGELNVGPAAIRSRIQEGPAASARWSWHPVLSFAAPSGDLGATVGEAEIRLPNDGGITYSKYVTVWHRQADGSLKFVVDGGSARPAPR